MQIFLLFKEIFTKLQNKEHLTEIGLQNIINIKASLNWGITDELKLAFPNTVVIERPLITDFEIPHPQWIAGFSTGEGCFLVNLRKSNSHRLGYQVMLVFKLTQHLRDKQLLKNFESCLGCGKYYLGSKGDYGDFKVWAIEDILNKVIPFFEKYPIQGEKLKDFLDFCKVASGQRTYVSLLN